MGGMYNGGVREAQHSIFVDLQDFLEAPHLRCQKYPVF